jgi:hypothetical protein
VTGGYGPEPTSRAGVAYRRALQELHRKKSTIDLVQYLAAQRNAAGCATPEDVLERLRDMDLPTATYEEIDELKGRFDRFDRVVRVLERVARVLDGSGWSGWHTSQRPRAMSFVANCAVAPDERVVEAAGRLLSQHWSDELANFLAPTIVAGLREASTDSLRRWTVRLHPEQAQRLLLAVTRELVRGPFVDAMPAFADLVWNPAPGTEPFQPAIHVELLQAPTLAAHLLDSAVEPGHDPDRLGVLLGAWDQASGANVGWAVPFTAAVAERPVAATDLAALAHVWPDGIVVAVRACLLRGRLAQMPSAMWAELIQFVALATTPGRNDLVAGAESLVSAALRRSLTEPECARIDLLSIGLHGIARASQARGFNMSEEYFREFSALWHQQGSAQLRGRLLTSAAVPVTNADHARHCMQLADAVGSDLIDPITRSVTAFMDQSLANWKAVIGVSTQRWTSILQQVYGDAIELERLCQQGGDRYQLLRAAVRATGNNRSLLQVVAELLADWARRQGDIGVYRLLMGLVEIQFIRQPPPFDEAAALVRSYVLGMVALGHFGDPRTIGQHMDSLRDHLGQQNKALQSEIKNAGKRR